MNAVDAKDPDETKWYVMDWTNALTTGATITGSSWSVDDGAASSPLTIADDEILSGALKTRVLLSGGNAGARVTVANTVTTSDGETLQRSPKLSIKAR